MNRQQYIEELFQTMSQLRKLMENRMQGTHEEKVATIMQYAALNFLIQNNNSTIGDIKSHLKVSKSSATQLIERLEKVGYINRLNDDNDKRIVRLIVTQNGEEYVKELNTKFKDKIGKILSKISQEDLSDLLRIHKNLIESLQSEEK